VRDAGGGLCYANPAAARLFGASGSHLYPHPLKTLGWTLCDEAGAPLPRSNFPSMAAFREGTPQRQRVVGIVAPDRPVLWVRIDCQPVLDMAGAVRYVVSTAVDVSRLKQHELALKMSESRYRRLLETTHEGVCVIGLDCTISFANSRLCEMLGYEQQELLGRHAAEMLGQWTGALRTKRRSVPERRREAPLRRRDGTAVWVMVGAMPMVDDAGQPAGLLAMFSDVTARKLSQERARAAAERIEQLVGDAIYTVDEAGRVHSWNDGAARLFGWNRDEVLGRRIPLVPENLQEEAADRIRHVIASGETEALETVRLTRQGRLVQVLGSWSPVSLEDGRTGVLCILKDTGSHRAAHEQLQEQARSLALLRERERIAMDLHDGTIQSLYGVALSLGALRRRADEADTAVLNGAIDQLTETIHGIREYIYELRTGVAEDANLELALKAKADELARQAGVMPHVSIEIDLRRLGSDTSHHLLYIVHEALSNVARHARATDVAIRIVPWRSGMMLSIVDNGRGFDPARKRRQGEGLHNMRERAALLGATLTIDSAPGTGTTVKVQIP
jgi:PAS domain S-box-containing protein